jgi:hydrogenase maturation protein HypF
LLFDDGAWTRDYERPLAEALSLLRRGGILAVRGLGGFHLAVDATDPAAVARLRERKGREAKPLAVMVPTLDAAADLAELSQAEARLLNGPARPIVLLRPNADAGLAPGIAPGLDRVGVVLAYTPLHQLLCRDFGGPLVMTSGNLTDEPIATGNAEACRRLAGVADGFLLHDREIVARYDDSLLRVVGTEPVLLRRARGFAPMPLELPIASPVPLVAVGPHLKNTLALVEGSTAFVSQHIGDLESLESLEHFQATLGMYRELFRIDPQVAVRDAHPGYLSSQLADELGRERVLVVQHHHAHIAAVMAEHGVTEPVIGVALDGTGYGSDGTIWGAEILRADLLGFERVGHLLPVALPGGDRAARAPWRCALAYLATAPEFTTEFALAFEGVRTTELAVARRQIAQRVNAPLASSMGRLFDAAAAVLGVRRESSYEGQAAMELEALAATPAGILCDYRLERSGSCAVLDPLPLLAELGFRRQQGEPVAQLAADFHTTLAAALAGLVGEVAAESGLRTVALGGGVFQNALLLTLLSDRLAAAGWRVLTARNLPANDGAISYGQAAVAAAILAAEGSR